MKPHENDNIKQLQHEIDAQEQALGALLDRVMQAPLTPLRTSLQELGERLDAVEKANARNAQALEAVVTQEMKAETRRLGSKLGAVGDELSDLKDELGELAATLERRDGERGERDARLGNGLARMDAGLHAIREQEQASAGQLQGTLAGIERHVVSQQAKLDGGFGKGEAWLEKLDARLDAAGNVGLAAGHSLERLGSELASLREQEQAGTGRLERQQAELGQRINAIPPALDPRFAGLAAFIEASAQELAQRSAALGEAQQATVTRTVQEQLALQLAPHRARGNWLFVLCGLSLASSACVFALLLMR
jgi:predicted  nucleic acid-binding Zn-ribbon protein